MDDIVWNIAGGIGISGLLVALFNIRQALLLGVGIGWLSLFSILVLSFPPLQETTLWAFIVKVIVALGNILLLLGLMGFYLICIYKNRDYIADGVMPDTWYLFSYFAVITFALNLMAIVSYSKVKSPGFKALSLVFTSLTAWFVFIEFIICTYFRTDGFLV